MKRKQEHVNLVRKIAWSFHKTTGIDWDELFLQASYLYYKAMKTYDPSRGKVTTYVWWLITSELTTYVSEEKKYNDPLDPIEVANYKPAQSPTPFLETLSKEAKIVADTVLANPEEFDCLSPEEAKKLVIQRMAENGVRLRDVWIGIRDITLACG